MCVRENRSAVRISLGRSAGYFLRVNISGRDPGCARARPRQPSRQRGFRDPGWECRQESGVNACVWDELFDCFRALRSGPCRGPESPTAGPPSVPAGSTPPPGTRQARGAGPPGDGWAARRDPETNVRVFYGAARAGLTESQRPLRHRDLPSVLISALVQRSRGALRLPLAHWPGQCSTVRVVPSNCKPAGGRRVPGTASCVDCQCAVLLFGPLTFLLRVRATRLAG
jgi:hypothetical protein